MASLSSALATLRQRVHAFELVTLVSVIATVVFLRSHRLRIGWQTFEYTVPPLIPVMAKYLAVGIVLYSLYLAVKQRQIKPYLRRLVSVPWLTLTLRLWLAIIGFFFCYMWLKVCVPLINHRLWDGVFWRLDTFVHLGFSPSIFLVELTRGTGLARWLDLWYGLWLPSVSLTIAFFLAMPGARVRRRFILSCVLIWVLGAWIYLALPALGPVYAFTPHFEEILPEMPHAREAQAMLWANYEKVVAGRDGDLKQFKPALGIAAMPSLHVGVHWLLMLWIRRYAHPFFAVAVVATGLTFLGSIVTGWHYAVDGYLGIGLACLCFWIANRTERPPGLRPAAT